MRRASVVAGAGGLVVGLVLGAAGVGLLRKDSTSNDDAPAKRTEEVAIQRRTLEVTETASGELASSTEEPLTTIGTGTVTAAAAVGESLGRGSTVVRVDDSPVVLMLGNEPVWRSFQVGMTQGADVRQLEENLVALHYASFTPDTTFDSATAAAVKRWETALGVTSPDGVVPAGQVVFASSAVQVTAAVAAGTRLSPGATIATVRPDDGSGLKLTFTVSEAADRYQPGQKVSIVTADAAVHPATITAFERVATSGGNGGAAGVGGGGGSASFTVTAVPDGGGAGLLPGPVTVEIPTQRSDNVLAVPSRALVAVVEGGQAVELAAGHKLVAVKIGTFADGWVEVSGEGLAEGAKVVVPA